MGQVLHGSATTTEAVRRAIQYSKESLRTLASRYGIQSEDRRQVEAPKLGCRSPNRAATAEVKRSLDAYNFGRRLKTLKGLTPYEFRFILNPLQQMPGLNI
jgi:hypothetical protein